MTIESKIMFTSGGHTVGDVRFPDMRQLLAIRAMDGLDLSIPAEIRLSNNQHVAGRPLVSGIRATVSSFGEVIGVAVEDQNHAAECNDSLRLVLHVPATVVRRLEFLRNGGEIVLDTSVEIRLSVLREVSVWRSHFEDLRVFVEPIVENDAPVVKAVMGEPIRSAGTVRLTVDASIWSDLLNTTGFGDNVFVEVPLPPSPGPPWDEVWKALRTARDALNRGGSMAWKTAVSECRIALERWENIEPVDHGNGGLTANRDQREARTIKQRQDALRWHAHQLAHYFQHNHSDECTRDDAALVLAILAGLLAKRRP